MELAPNLIRSYQARDAREAARARDESRNGRKTERQGLVVWKIDPSQSKNPAKNRLT